MRLNSSRIALSRTKEFTWRRLRLRFERTIFNYVAVFNQFEYGFAVFLDRSREIAKLAALAETFTGFKIDYFEERKKSKSLVR